MSTGVAPSQIDRARIKELTERESKRLDEATPASKAMFERARAVMPGGVPSSYQSRHPWPLYLERGEGAVVWDVDGRRLWDFHNARGQLVGVFLGCGFSGRPVCKQPECSRPHRDTKHQCESQWEHA